MIGPCALHLLAGAVAELCKVKGWSTMLCCDNKQALEKSSHHQFRVQPSAKCADLGGSLRFIKQTFTGNFWYVPVYCHMDRYLTREQLMLTQQLNCVCNMLAKQAIMTAIIHSYHKSQTQLLPNKDVALIIWSNKIMGNILSPLQFHASKEVARKHLASCKKDKWSHEWFDAVD